MDLSNETILIIIAIGFALFFLAVIWLLVEFKGMKDLLITRAGINNETLKLTLQAYERLTLFTERTALKNLISRTTATGLTVVEVQLVLTNTIREEYEYNISQQIYLQEDVWKAIINLKDQNIYIINQLAATLPPQANGIELSRRILEYAANNNAELSGIVLEALRFEVKKLL